MTSSDNQPETVEIIIVNDDMTQLRVLSEILRKEGMQPTPCLSAEEALNIMSKRKPPSLIITDLHMPNIDGWRFCRLLRSPEYVEFNEIPILVVSATYSGDDAHQITTELGANSFLPSPINHRFFIDQVNALLSGEAIRIKTNALIIDDSETLAKMIKSAFEKHDYIAWAAHTGSDGMVMFRELKPEIVILDYHLPDMLGDDLIHEMRQLNPHTVIIIISTNQQPELAVRWMSNGASAYLRKPFDMDYLITLCDSVRRERSMLHVEDRLKDRTRELRESETRYRHIFENSPVMMYSVDEEGNYVNVNRKWLEYMGYELGDILGKRIDQVMTPESGNRIVSIGLPGLWIKKHVQDSSYEFIKSDGTVIDVLLNCEVVTDPSGKRVSLSAMRDVTEHNRAKFALANRLRNEKGLAAFSQELLSNVYDALTHAMRHLLDASGVSRVYIFENFSDPVDGLCIRQTHEVCAKGVTPEIDNIQLQHCPYDNFLARWLKELSNNKPVFGLVESFPESERSILDPQGILSLLVLPIWVDEEYYGFIGFDDTQVHRKWSNEDIQLLQTAAGMMGEYIGRRRVEDALRESEDKYRTVFENTGAATIIIDNNTNITLANKGIEALFGYTREEMEGNRSWIDLVDEEYKEKIKLYHGQRRSGNEDVPKEYEIKVVDKHGAKKDVFITVDVIPGTKSSVASLIDITERKRAAKEKRKLEARIQQAQKFESLNVMAGSIAHNFNNILMAVLGNIELALHDLPKDSPVRSYLMESHKAGQRAAELSSMMVTYVGKNQVEMHRFDISHMISEMSDMLKATLGRNMELRISLSDAPALMNGDKASIRQAIMNLVTNAKEALGDSRGEITITTGAKSCDRDFLQQFFLEEELAEGEYAYVDITDTGCGMDKETMSKVFDPFFTTKFPGRGLGLAAVLGIVRGHQGGISFKSKPGQGARARLLFPIVGVKNADNPDIETNSSASFNKESDTILLVDDEAMILDIGKIMLENLGYKVLLASNGQEALDIFRQQSGNIRCAIIDMSMPRMDGMETFSKMKEIDDDVCVIVASGYIEDQMVGRFKDTPPKGYIQKPYQSAMLEEKLNTIFELRESE
jgi:two-component system, cell cycle sensor histidine kinase and response regulator CckA